MTQAGRVCADNRLGAVDHVHLTETVRRVTRQAISATGGIDSKGGQWVTQPT
jgi:hypothetical protein